MSHKVRFNSKYAKSAKLNIFRNFRELWGHGRRITVIMHRPV